MSFFTAGVSAITGMGGGVLLLSVMSFFLPLEMIVPVHGVIQLVSNMTRTYILRSYIQKPFVQFFILGLPLGVFLAVSLIKEVENREGLLLIIAALIAYTLFKPKRLPNLFIPKEAFSILGLISGFLGIFIGATGPFLAPFFLRKDLMKKQIVATKAICQLFMHLIKIPAFISLGFVYQDHFSLLLSCCAGAILGTKFGVQILGVLSENSFRFLYRSILFTAMLRLIYKGAFTLL